MDKFLKLMSFSKTKTLGYLIAFAGTYYGFKNVGVESMGVMLQSWYLSALLVGGKTISDSVIKVKSGGKENV